MASKVIKSSLLSDDTIRVPARLRTAKEASQLLEELRKGFQSLTPEKKRKVRSIMSDLLESQRQFGSTAGDLIHITPLPPNSVVRDDGGQQALRHLAD